MFSPTPAVPSSAAGDFRKNRIPWPGRGRGVGYGMFFLGLFPIGEIAVAQVKTVADWMAERSISLAGLVDASGLEQGVVEAIAAGRYTPSPQQRQCLAAALGVDPEQVAWGHQAEVVHIYGHGPQFGRSP